jgi:hypothetical protein
VLLAERVAVTTATNPLPMAVLFDPDATQIKVPTPELQLSVSPTDVRAEPATAVRDVTAADGYANVHCSADGAPLPAFNERFSETELPWTAAPEAKLNDEV